MSVHLAPLSHTYVLLGIEVIKVQRVMDSNSDLQARQFWNEKNVWEFGNQVVLGGWNINGCIKSRQFL